MGKKDVLSMSFDMTNLPKSRKHTTHLKSLGLREVIKKANKKLNSFST